MEHPEAGDLVHYTYYLLSAVTPRRPTMQVYTRTTYIFITLHALTM
jgi:hypothetical protein